MFNPLNIGKQGTEDFHENLTLEVINFVSIAITCIYIFFTIFTAVLQRDFWGWFPNSIGILVGVAPLLLNANRHYKPALLWELLVVPLYIVFCVFIWGTGKGTQFYIFFAAFLSVVILRQQKQKLLVFLYDVVCFAACYIINYLHYPIYTHSSWPQVWYANLITLFLTSPIIFVTYNRSVGQYQEELALKAKDLKNAMNLKDKIYSVVAHDLKNPISIIRSLSELLCHSDAALDGNQKELAEEIRSTVEITHDLVKNLLDWAKAQSWNLYLDFQPVLYKNVVETAVKTMKTALEKKAITIIHNYPSELSIYCDMQTFTSVVRNIISNAISYSPEKSTIVLKSKKTKDEIILEIIDEGPGIDQKIINILLNKKVLSGSSAYASRLSTSLGLIICRDFMELNRGKFEILNNPEKGCCCRLHFKPDDRENEL